MAISLSQSLTIVFFFFFLFFSAVCSATAFASNFNKPMAEGGGGEDVHDILPKYDLPRGLFPDVSNSYSVSSDGSFVIHLLRSCYVHFDDQLVYYDKLIKGKLSSGSVSGVSGIQAKKLFLWVPVTGMDLDPDTNTIQFHVGAISQSLPVDSFQTVPRCMSKISHHLKSLPLFSS